MKTWAVRLVARVPAPVRAKHAVEGAERHSNSTVCRVEALDWSRRGD